MDLNNPPEELVAQCEEINRQWLTDRAKAVPMQYVGERSWKIEVRTHSGHPLIQHLFPERADGHTLAMAVYGIRVAKEKAFLDGKGETVRTLTKLACKTLNIDTSYILK